MINDIYELIEDLPVYKDWYGKNYGNGTLKKGTRFKLLREPIPKKKLYKLIEINVTNINYEPSFLYLRKNEFNKIMRKIEDDKNNKRN